MMNTERLHLRSYKTTDYERVHLYGSLPDFSQYDVWGPNTKEDTHNFIADCISKYSKNPIYEFELAVCLIENELLIGGCGIRRDSQESKVASLGYAIHPDFQSKGYATEVTSKLIEFGFNELNLAVIYATCDTRNTASFKVMEKLEMKRVGHIKEHKQIRGHMRDSYRYEIYSAK